MYIGHVGAALAAKRVRASVGLLPLLIATYLPDWTDAGLCLAGAYHPAAMLSHSIPSVLIFALVGFGWYAMVTHDRTGGFVIAALIVSHMLLDWITGYKPTWPGGPMIGLQFYEYPIADFLAEGATIVFGTLLYVRTLPGRRRLWVNASIMMAALLVLQLMIDLAHLLIPSISKC